MNLRLTRFRAFGYLEFAHRFIVRTMLGRRLLEIGSPEIELPISARRWSFALASRLDVTIT